MKQFSVIQSRWMWKGGIFAVILSGILMVMFFPWLRPDFSRDLGGVGHPVAFNEPLSQPESRTASLTPGEMKAFLTSRGKASPPRDPFLSPGEDDWTQFLHGLKGRPPRLEGILRIGSVGIAIFNHSRFREGEEVEGFKVLKINEKDVVLGKNGGIYRVPIIQ